MKSECRYVTAKPFITFHKIKKQALTQDLNFPDPSKKHITNMKMNQLVNIDGLLIFFLKTRDAGNYSF